MNGAIIEDNLRSHPVTKNTFVGVFAADQVPHQFDKYPVGCIVNSDPADKPGQHWIAIYQDNLNHLEFFDSYGKNPSFYSISLPQHTRMVKQDVALQSAVSTVCGQYCMFFIFQRCAGVSFSEFTRLFSSNKFGNDLIVQSFINRVFRLKTDFMDIKFLLR